LKIDGSFVMDIATNAVSQSVVAAISEVARVMELNTVAECVQGNEALTLLRDLGVTYGQGFLLGKPEPLQAALGSLGVAKQESRVTA
jgi:EAL domain-containing protein (putative c-di-GMP-specific phosphodiesterase class I)